ncbi:MAG: sterol desaturase family protein [Gammaproteobacteria bacterium]|nr:sterol desaturase family protein [Gammaproteobacteria bacterium]
MNAVLYVLPVFLLLIVAELVASKLIKRQVYRLNDAITSISIGYISEFIRGLVKLVTFGIYAILETKVGQIDFQNTDPLAWILAFILYDFFYYWMHRAGHEINLLWGAHSVHHSSEYFNMSTAMRQSATTVFYNWIFYLPMAVLGIPWFVFVVTSFASLFYQYWVHTELIPKMGWFDRVFVSPSNHRVHHGQNSYCIDKNYGATLILWDRLFGTYAEEQDQEPVIYGIRSKVKSWNPVWANLFVFNKVFSSFAETKGWKNKLMRLFGPPGWEPETGAVVKTQFEPTEFQKYDTQTSPAQSFYTWVSYLSLSVFFYHFLTIAYSMPVWPRIAYGCLIGLQAFCIGGVLENKRLIRNLDIFRGISVFCALIANWWFSEVSMSGLVLAITGMIIFIIAHVYLYKEERQTRDSTVEIPA